MQFSTHSRPAVLLGPFHSYRVQMDFNNLYKQVGYAQSLQF